MNNNSSIEKTVALLLLTVAAFSTAHSQSIESFTYDFLSVNASGDTLYYDITDSTAKTVAVKGRWGDMTEYYTYVQHYSGVLTIPDTVENGGERYAVTAIADLAFYSQLFIDSIAIPHTVTTIGRYAFSAYGIGDQVVGDQVESIGEMAFDGVRNLVYHGTAAGAPWGATAMNAYCEDSIYYADASKQTIVSSRRDIVAPAIPTSVTKVGRRAFFRCESLRAIELPEGIDSVMDHAFYMCESMQSLSIPSTMRYIGPLAFSSCGEFPYSTTTYEPVPTTFEVVFHDATECVVDSFAFINAYITSLDLGTGVKSVGKRAFSDLIPLSELTLPSGHYADSAFMQCFELRRIELPQDMDSLPDGMFRMCESLRAITLPATMRHIGRAAFEGDQYVELTVMAYDPPTVADATTFAYVNINNRVKVPCGRKQAYESAPYWSDFAYIKEMCDGIEGAEAEGVDVVVVDGCIVVRNAEGRRVHIYDLGGREVGPRVPAAGVYMVAIEGAGATRVVVPAIR